MALLDVKGLRAEIMYFKGTLDKLGVSMEFEHVGKYRARPSAVIDLTEGRSLPRVE